MRDTEHMYRSAATRSHNSSGLANRMAMEISMRGIAASAVSVPLVTLFRAHANEIGRVLIYTVTFALEIKTIVMKK